MLLNRWKNRALALVAFVCMSGSVYGDLLDDPPPSKVEKPEQTSEQNTDPSNTVPDTDTVPADVTPIKKTAPKKPDAPIIAKPKNTSRSVLAPSKKRKPKKNAEKEPVHFESDGARGIRDKGKFELIDNVIVTQGTMRMEADKATVFVDTETNDVKTVHAVGKVKLFQEDAETGERLKAFGDEMVFDNIKRTVILSGNARLWRGPSLVKGKQITYELDTGWIYADRVVGELQNDAADEKGN